MQSQKFSRLDPCHTHSEKQLSKICHDYYYRENGSNQKVNYSDWVMPVVPMPMAGGQVYLCGDFKVTILLVDQHPIPKAEDCLTGRQHFSKLNLTQAYQQMLDLDDCKYTIVHTHQGYRVYGFTRLPFGSASALVKQTMEKYCKRSLELQFTLMIVLITGKSNQEPLSSIQIVG